MYGIHPTHTWKRKLSFSRDQLISTYEKNLVLKECTSEIFAGTA
jgi:hypothetical protein